MLFSQIEQNKRKTVFLVFLFVCVVIVVGAGIGYMNGGGWASGLTLALVISAFYIPITYASANAQVLAMSGARHVTAEEYPVLYNIVEGLCIPAQIPMPKIYVVDDPSPNAFATGLSPKKGSVAFTTGLLQRLNREELEAVAAHEIGHIRNYDIRLMTVSIALVGVIALLANIGTRMLFFRNNRDDRKNQNPIVMIVALVLVILSPIVAQFVHFAVSRNREYLADASAVEFTRNAQGMISALRKISESDSRQTVHRATPTTASMYITNPFNKDRQSQSFTNWFATHPSILSRIERLENM
jgi:heat shock protein HtpX